MGFRTFRYHGPRDAVEGVKRVAAGGESIRVRGLVQGVGFRPTVWRHARKLGLQGDVRNDGAGVLIRAWGEPGAIDALCEALGRDCPPLARIDALERQPLREPPATAGFAILMSDPSRVRTGVVPDAATCAACRAEILDPADRRYRYPFTNCTHCGPRLSIVRAIPYDRANTSMAGFSLCPDCLAEYQDPSDRRFHAQPNACPECGPRVWLEDRQGKPVDPTALGAPDAIAAASRLLAGGAILALKGIGGFHLACDATHEGAVSELRRRKRRFAKPFALMARDLDSIRRYCRVDEPETALLQGPAAPILLLEVDGKNRVAPSVAPGQRTLGFMLPYSPLQHLLLADWERPLVMTSGNLSDEPQCIDNSEAKERLALLADYFLLHDRDILNRVDDSVARVLDGAPRLLRRARGHAPGSLALPADLAAAPNVLAMGGELKNSFCLTQGGRAILSQHLGDLEEGRTAAEYERTLDLYQGLFEHSPQAIAVDLHPDYRSSQRGRAWAAEAGLPLVEVQHHHAHIASVLAENDWPLARSPVLGIALDGLGYGPDGTLWGGELLLADYRAYRRVGWLRPTSLPGGMRAVREPWRNSFAQIAGGMGWEAFRERYGALELRAWLEAQPLGLLGTLMARGLQAPLSSSCGRLCDAVAGALGICREGMSYEGQAAMELETLAQGAWNRVAAGYPFGVVETAEALVLDPAPLWEPLFDDLLAGTEGALIAARFHLALVAALADLAERLAQRHQLDTLALSGGVLQNRILFEGLVSRLRARGFRVLTQRQVPSNDGGIALGQAAVAAARLVTEGTR